MPAHVRLPRHSRTGFALPLALSALVVVALLVTGVYYSSNQQVRTATEQGAQETAFRAAERGLALAAARWSTPSMITQVRGAAQAVAYDVAGSFTDTVRIVKLDTAIFLVTSSATVGTGANQARRDLTQLVRLTAPTFNFLGALTVRGTSKIGGSSYINGYDTPPSGWTTCPPPGTAMPGLANTGGRSNVDLSGCTASNLKCIDGNPDIQRVTAAGDTNTYFSYGDLKWPDLVAAATITLPAGATYTQIQPSYGAGGSCNRGDVSNWGDPNRGVPSGACEGYFPIIHFAGSANTQVTNGTGQGILLVDGDLTLTGNFVWYGPVIIRGALQTSGSGGKIYGGVLAADVNLDMNTVLGDAVINYSTCSIQAAVLGASTPRPVKQRAFAQQF